MCSTTGVHNNSDCTDKVAALEGDEADTATARTTVLIEKINIAENLRMNSEPARILRFSRALASQAAVASNITAPHDWLGSWLCENARKRKLMLRDSINVAVIGH